MDCSVFLSDEVLQTTALLISQPNVYGLIYTVCPSLPWPFPRLGYKGTLSWPLRFLSNTRRFPGRYRPKEGTLPDPTLLPRAG